MRRNSAAKALLATNEQVIPAEQVRELERFLEAVNELAQFGLMPSTSFGVEPALGRGVINAANATVTLSRANLRQG